MKHALAFACLLICLALQFPAEAQVPDTGLPSGELARGTIQPVPEGDLVIGVADGGIGGMGANTLISGPSGFLISMGVGSGFNVKGSNHSNYHLNPWGAIFLPGNVTYTLNTGGDWAAGFRFIAFGTGIKSYESNGTLYYSEPIPWGPGSGNIYDMHLIRDAFPSGSSTPWHLHSGPTFSILEGGSWENRQIDGTTTRLVAAGYYAQAANRVHQVAQIGEGGYALSVEFYPPNQPKTTDAPGLGLATPTTLTVTTPVPDHFQYLYQSTPTTLTPTEIVGEHPSSDWLGGVVLVVSLIGMACVGALLWLHSRTR